MRPWLTSGRLLPGPTLQWLWTRVFTLAQPQLKTTNAGTAGHAGTPQLRQLNTVNIDMFRHPKYYKELRKRNKSDQAISLRTHDGGCERATGPGHKLQAREDSTANSTRGQVAEPQASSSKRIKQQATSIKPQAQRLKLQATSFKRQDS